jgi:hypothetical protein
MKVLYRPVNSASSNVGWTPMVKQMEAAKPTADSVVFRCTSPIIQGVCGNFRVGTKGDSYSKKHENLFLYEPFKKAVP